MSSFILYRHIFKSQLKNIFLVLFVFVALILIAQLLEYSNRLNKMSAIEQLNFIGYKAFNQLYKLWTIILVIGTIIGMIKLKNSNQLTALRCSALSKLSIFNLCVSPAIILSILFIVSFQIKSSVEQRQYKSIEEIKDFAIWHKTDNSYINITNVNQDGSADNITIWQLDLINSQFQQVYMADTVFYKNKQWVSNNDKTITLPSIDSPVISYSQNNVVQLPDLYKLYLMQNNLEKSPILDLLKYHSLANAINKIKIENIILKTLSMPILLYLLAMLSSIKIFSSVRSGAAKSTFYCVSSAVLIYMVFIFLELATIIYGLQPIISYISYLTIVGLTSFYFFKRPLRKKHRAFSYVSTKILKKV